MRELIKPILFIIARTGLCLAVVAWIVGHWRMVEVASHSEMNGLCAVFGHNGIAISVNDPGTTALQPWMRTRPRTDHLYMFFVPADEIHDDLPPDWESGDILPYSYFYPEASLTVNWGTLDSPFIAVRHWLIITTFALFYGMLKWVYRKRGTDVTIGRKWLWDRFKLVAAGLFVFVTMLSPIHALKFLQEHYPAPFGLRLEATIRFILGVGAVVASAVCIRHLWTLEQKTARQKSQPDSDDTDALKS